MVAELQALEARINELQRDVDGLQKQVDLITKPVLSVSEVAKFLGTSRQTVYTMIKEQGLPTRQWGNRQAVLRVDLEAWLATLPPAE